MKKIRVLIYNEYIHERGNNEVIKKLYPEGIHTALKTGLSADDFEISVANLDMPEHGLSEEILSNTDVLLWWAHANHGGVSDEAAKRVQKHVLNGMGFVPLHSSHASKPFRFLMGTSCDLLWRCAGEHVRVWNINPSHPITRGIDANFMIEHDEMYGEFFDIPKPDEIIFISWYQGGEVFRSGCTFLRGMGKIFYFQPGHEDCAVYYNENVLKVISNAIRWAAPIERKKIKFGYSEPLERI